MTKDEHILYWIGTAKQDWKAVNDLFAARNYVHALFFAHLVLEKLLKATWVKDNVDNTPPKTHNLIVLLSNTKYDMADEDKQFLSGINQFQLEGRYPDYTQKIYTTYKSKQTKPIIEHVNLIRKCLLKNLS